MIWHITYVTNLEEVKEKHTLVLKNMLEYYNVNGLKLNPSKTNPLKTSRTDVGLILFGTE